MMKEEIPKEFQPKLLIIHHSSLIKKCGLATFFMPKNNTVNFHDFANDRYTGKKESDYFE